MADLADKAILKNVWKKRLRSQIRKMPLREFHLGHDALEWLAFDWELDATVERLSEELKNGSYRARQPETVRAAKSVGLTRPLAFMAPRDLVVYKALIQLVENQLLSSMPEWSRFGRADHGDDGDTAAQSGWFRAWLRRQDQVWVITDSHDWLVESDVANFFASLHTGALLDHVNNSAALDEVLVGLFDHLLREFAPTRGFRPSRVGGLPQENFDCSRILAHTFLRDLDMAFEDEGNNSRYSRWVDDIIIGADSWPEALQLVKRIQVSLELLDLHPNASKTRIMRRTDFAVAYMKDENDYIGEVSEQMEEHGAPTNPSLLRRRIQSHARSSGSKGWERVLRRYYTLAKRTRSDALMSWWERHLREAPGSAPQILEYLSTFRLTEARLAKLRSAVDSFGGTYQDIALLATEYLLLAPNTNSRPVRESAVSWARGLVEEHLHSWPRLASTASVIVMKFGFLDDIDWLHATFEREMLADSALRQQVAVALFSTERLTEQQLSEMLHDATPEGSQHVRFLSALNTGDKGAVDRALAMVQPVARPNPARFQSRPRPMLLTPLLARANAARYQSLSSGWLSNLRTNELRLRDAALERWLTGQVDQIITP